MFFDLDLRGDALPPKTLCLTYDDGPGRTEGGGPGPQTAELGHFLAERGIPATFFVIGAHVRANPGIVARLRAGGHLVANHTDTHPTLVSFVRDGGDVAEDLARADLAIGSPSASGDVTYFRAPYGNWREDPEPSDPEADATTSMTAQILNDGGRFPHMVGPIGWDIDQFDWNHWKSGTTAEECGQSYLEAIEAQGRGIVLLHDSSESEVFRVGNRAFEMTRWLVPLLEERGYRFVRLDQVPGVVSASRVTRQVAFGTEQNQWLTCPATSTRLALTPADQLPRGRERFGVVPVGHASQGELVGLRAWNGCYLARTKSGAILAEAATIEDSSRWQLVTDGSGRVEIRSSQHESVIGLDLATEVGLKANAPHPIRFATDPLVEVAAL